MYISANPVARVPLSVVDNTGVNKSKFPDPDAPSREKPTYREWLHWLVVNVYGDNIAGGDIIAEYVGAGPGRDTGLHRYVFLVYEQPYWVVFSEPRLTNRLAEVGTFFKIMSCAWGFPTYDIR